MTEGKKLDDSRLLDLLIEQRDAEVRDDLDPEARARLDELRRIHDGLRAVANEASRHELGEDAMAAVVRRAESAPAATPVVPLRTRRWRPIAVAAALMIVAALAWTAFGPGGATRTVEAGVFGGLELVRDGRTVVTPVDHRLGIRPGDVILSRGGGELDIGEGIFLKIGQKARLVCLQVSDRSAVLALETGRLRCEGIAPGRASLTIHTGAGLTLTAGTGAVFALQSMGKPDDQLEVDAGSVAVRCTDPGGPNDTISSRSGPYSLHDRCTCDELPDAKKVVLEPCHHRGKRPDIRPGLPTQTDPQRALELARHHHVPVLVTREDGPDVSPCYRSCCFVDFLTKRRGLGGVVWLVLHPEKHAADLTRYNLADDVNGVVVLNHRGEVVDRGHIESDDGMYAAVLSLIRSGRAKCTR